jgi:hypothetical protein
MTGLLARVPIDVHVHLMDRQEPCGASLAIDSAEGNADRLAFELLAPWETVRLEMQELGIAQDRQAVLTRLTMRYGLPPGPADRYAHLLIPERQMPSALLDFLRRES